MYLPTLSVKQTAVTLFALALSLATTPHHAGAQTDMQPGNELRFEEWRAPVDVAYPSSGLLTAIELVIVKPFFEDGVRDAAGTVRPSFGYQPSLRYILGYEFTSGLGVRSRYWSYDHTSETAIDPVLGGVARQSIEAQVFDFDLTQRFTAAGFDLVASYGARYARFRVDDIDENDGLAPVRRNEFEGIGPTVALDVSRPLWSGLTFVANGRGSLLLGSTDVLRTGGADPTIAATDDDDMVLSLESQAGLEYGIRLRGGSRLALRALMEAQIWNGAFEQPGETSATHDDLGTLFGGTFSILYSW